MNNTNNNVYILSLDASDIFCHMIREKSLKDNFCGMIPYSLELIKLKSIRFKFKTDKIKNKETSKDIINVKFKNKNFDLKIHNGKDTIKNIKKKIAKIDKKYKAKVDELKELIPSSDNTNIINKCTQKMNGLKKYLDSLNEFLKDIQKQIDEYKKDENSIVFVKKFVFYNAEINIKFNKIKIRVKEHLKTKLNKPKRKLNKRVKLVRRLEEKYYQWDEMSNQVLREYLYENGFTIETKNKKTGKIKKEKYVVYKRSSAKSRTGQCLFIKEKLLKPMIDWARMYLPFIKGQNADYASLLAYESLVGSSLEGIIEINPKNILIVNDIPSEFKHKCNIIRKDADTGRLNSFYDDYEISNNLFDGESLLASQYYKDGQSMKLLRQHMFKSAAFNTNIQLYLRDNCPEGIEFDKWEIKNMFNQSILAKDIEMIFCPTSLKALKFDKDLNMTQEAIWEHWKKIVESEGCIFGICKHEKASKRGKDELGNMLQQTSYQMVNSLGASDEDIESLTQFERDYVSRLKNDDEFFIEYAIENANAMNSNLMFAELAKWNSDFMNTEIFRTFRTTEINSHVTHCKSGKIRLSGDYAVILGNGLEFLAHAIGKFDINTVDVNKLPLKDNEIYTKLHDFNSELVCFRNPHTSPSNVLIAKNKYVEEIETYFNLSSNVICVNAIKFPIQDILSSMDYDSDSVVIFKSEKLLKIAHKCYGKYKVCVNDVESDKKQYKLTARDMYRIDSQLANSQRNIGEVVNLGQLCMSTYWDLLKRGKTEDELSDLMKSVDVMTILSGICIDLAKKFYQLDINAEINQVRKSKLLKLKEKKPLVWKYVNNMKKNKVKVEFYECPMDYLIVKMSKLPNPEEQHPDINLLTLLVDMDQKADHKQEEKVFNYVENMVNDLNYINAKNTGNEDHEVEERNNLIDNTIRYYNYYMNKITVNKNTMISILKHMINNDHTDIQTKLLNVLFITQKDVFLEAFKVKNKNCSKSPDNFPENHCYKHVSSM